MELDVKIVLKSRGFGEIKLIIRQSPVTNVNGNSSIEKRIFCHQTSIGEGSIPFVSTPAAKAFFFSQTPGRRPLHITGLRVNSVPLGLVGAPNERVPFRFHDPIAPIDV